ncbi:transposase, partial [Xanthomonas arboricola pv. corylina]
MKTSRFTDSQIIAVLKQSEAGTPVPQLCREHGISSATFYKWRSKFGGM